MATCDSCGIRLGVEVILAGGEGYCCAGCAAGGPCNCTYEHDLGRYPPSHYAKPVSLAELFDRYERSADRAGEVPSPDES